MGLLPELLTFICIIALGQFSPGPDMVLLTRTALAGGARTGILMSLGIATGLVFHASIAAAGASVLMAGEGILPVCLKFLAAFYLLYLAWKIWPAKGKDFNGGAKPGKLANPYLQGLLCNLLNPKVALVLAAIMAPFIGATDWVLWPWLLALVIVAQGALLWILWSVLLQHPRIRKFHSDSITTIDRLFSIGLAVMAASLYFLR